MYHMGGSSALRRGCRACQTVTDNKDTQNVSISFLPRADSRFNCRDIDSDSTRFIECNCGGLSDCDRPAWSDGGKTRQPMVVKRIILNENLLFCGLLQIRQGRLFMPYPISRLFIGLTHAMSLLLHRDQAQETWPTNPSPYFLP